MDHEILRAAKEKLTTRRLGRTMRGFESVDSTNRVARNWFDEGAPDGALVFAELQTAGRGRMGRVWTSDSGSNLTFSLVLRPRVPAESSGLIPLIAALSVARSIEKVASPIRCTLKWPNDVLIRERKCAGVLAESFLRAPDPWPQCVVLGIGVNVNQEVFPDDLDGSATSVLIEMGSAVDRSGLLARILNELEPRLDELHEGSTAPSLRAFEAKMPVLGSSITLRRRTSPSEVTGILLGLSDDGSIRISTESGERRFHEGEVTTKLSVV